MDKCIGQKVITSFGSYISCALATSLDTQAPVNSLKIKLQASVQIVNGDIAQW